MGAKRRDILLQFVAEATLLSLGGGAGRGGPGLVPGQRAERIGHPGRASHAHRRQPGHRHPGPGGVGGNRAVLRHLSGHPGGIAASHRSPAARVGPAREGKVTKSFIALAIIAAFLGVSWGGAFIGASCTGSTGRMAANPRPLPGHRAEDSSPRLGGAAMEPGARPEARGNHARVLQAVAGRATGSLPGRTGVPASRAPNPHQERTGARE